MRLQVQVGAECIVVACQEGDSIHQVCERALAKLKRLRPSLWAESGGKEHDGDAPEYKEIRRTIGNALLDPNDSVEDVLVDSDFVQILLPSDLPSDEAESRQAAQLRTKVEAMRTGRIKKLSFNLPEPEWVEPEGPRRILVLDGSSLQPIDLVKCERGEYEIRLAPDSEARIRKARHLLERLVTEHKTVYGVTTGFGTFANVRIDEQDLQQLQINLIRSHATGYGQPLSPRRARMLLALRINVLAKGYSGISLDNIRRMIAAFNAFCVSWVPQQGTVGCSGDLCPLAHLALGLLGEGRMWSPLTGWEAAGVVLRRNGLEPMVLGPKEGLALINGTQMVTALGALALERANNIAKQADVIAALSLDVLKGTTRAYDTDIHAIRPHKGQITTARRLRALLHSEANPSQIAESHRNCGRVQDAYTMRCVPQVHGVVHDTIDFVRSIITVELNSATDNPLVFADRGEIISGGNFHGEYPAKALDYLAIAVHELAQMSERRLERLVNGQLSGLPTFLTTNGGLNSGFMTVQVCAAALVSENKVLCHPASVDSIPTSCNQEDHVSMGGMAARKALQVVEHVEAVLAMELLAACQAFEFLRPLRSTAPLNKVYQLVRATSAPLTEDRFLQPDIERVTEMLRQNKVWEAVQPHLATLRELEQLDPDALRHEMKTPTGIVRAERLDEDDEEDELQEISGRSSSSLHSSN